MCAHGETTDSNVSRKREWRVLYATCRPRFRGTHDIQLAHFLLRIAYFAFMRPTNGALTIDAAGPGWTDDPPDRTWILIPIGLRVAPLKNRSSLNLILSPLG
jgi:hypothetical protein